MRQTTLSPQASLYLPYGRCDKSATHSSTLPHCSLGPRHVNWAAPHTRCIVCIRYVSFVDGARSTSSIQSSRLGIQASYFITAPALSNLQNATWKGVSNNSVNGFSRAN